ncbi:MAG: bifunctional adenosylcobinamide kinase/adenosylcobinamide-phosphate guanylyltransferase [Parasporobacterium sp.]|nr:bifunctional adenosylcobinamide kinase/adenosylcobinamide-phosphate guanylyltransferase [Parasporobacterium sp.]
MQIVIGGFSQGKLGYVLNNMCSEGEKVCVLDENDVTDSSVSAFEEAFRSLPGEYEAGDACTIVVNHLHLILKNLGNRERTLKLMEILREYCYGMSQNLIIISDELGCGIIPAEQEERTYREDAGRIMCTLAAEADSVTRIVAGIPVRIK